jgi:hypothetical protein
MARLRGADSAEMNFFETKIRPVLAARCYACHSARAPKIQGGLLLDSAAGLKKGGNSGPIFVAGNPDASLLIRAIRYRDRELKMPPGKALDPEVAADFEAWVKSGAALPADSPAVTKANAKQTFWAFQRPEKRPVPPVKSSGWVRNEIDAFVLAKLESKGLAPSAGADRRTLIRRVTYDLTGLPPSADEIEAFVKDRSPDPYPALVDRLLSSPRYGERWGRYWLDIARYSDARNVGERFAFSYTYRDWVIRAINEDMPYDRFLTLQLAADLLPSNHDRSNLAALGFLSLGREFPKAFPETVDDRIDVVSRGMLGLTVACARCHDHKYDPIPTKDYYSFYSIFSDIREPADLPLLNSSGRKTELDRIWEPRLQKIREIDREYRQRRNAEMIAFFKTQIGEYLIAVRDSRQMSNTEMEELVRERQLNLHLLGRWRQYLAQARTANDLVFRLWTALADLPDAEFAARSRELISADTGSNSRLLEAFRANPPASIKDAAALYQKVLLEADRAERSTGAAEPLRLALRSPEAPVNLPVGEFDLIYTEGDGNNTRGFRDRYNTTRAMYAYAGAAPRAMAMEDVSEPKIAHIFVRGNANNPGAETPPHFLSTLTPGEPRVFHKGSGRLELAEAIADPANPLTARVAVNRVWAHHFGSGIVRSPSDFGLRGDAPSHPELLDYLAVSLVENGWSLKKLHRQILLSATYRQSSADNPAARKIDPENQLVWRMNRQRLDVESLRDSLLAAAGQLDLSAGGPAYSLTAQPPVPRRTVYGYVERGRVPAFLNNFDFASPDTHAPMRYTTTVPQQALYLLNSSFVAEQAARLAARTEGLPVEERIRRIYRYALGRDATAAEVALGVRFIDSGSGQEAKPAPDGPWQFGFGDGRSFTAFRYFVDETWQDASMLPDSASGGARLRANGGAPGDGPEHAAVRRWISPVSGKISIEGSLRHAQGAIPAGDGVHARIVSTRHGEIASWVVNGNSAETILAGVSVEKGDGIDFIVDGRADIENDAFTWAPRIKLAGSTQIWDSATDFEGPRARVMTAWDPYAQVLLQTNEFAFVD